MQTADTATNATMGRHWCSMSMGTDASVSTARLVTIVSVSRAGSRRMPLACHGAEPMPMRLKISRQAVRTMSAPTVKAMAPTTKLTRLTSEITRRVVAVCAAASGCAGTAVDQRDRQLPLLEHFRHQVHGVAFANPAQIQAHTAPGRANGAGFWVEIETTK